MVNIPYEQIVEKIKEKGISQEEIDSKVKSKMDQLSGLISKEGAAHIIANEMGIQVMEQSSGKLSIKNLLPGMRNVELVGKVVQVYEVREFQKGDRSGKVGSFIIGDETGTVRVVLWGDQADKLNEITKDNVIKLESGYVKDNNNRKEVHVNERGSLEINPEGESVGEVKAPETNRKSISELKEGDSDAELMGTIVQVYDLRFFEVCPQCSKRLKQGDNGFVCDVHNEVTPTYSYVLGLVLDDGSSNIRTVFFRNQVQNLLEKSHEDIEKYRELPDKFDEVKHNLLGKQIKIVGRINKNTMMDRLEFIAQRVFPNPDPEEEKKRIEESKKEDKDSTDEAQGAGGGPEPSEDSSGSQGASAGTEQGTTEDTGNGEGGESPDKDKDASWNIE
ncbi:MAG: OB-fold nucleic acid binding domain-containing protein [Candidatus Woesearchaeota archaeon]